MVARGRAEPGVLTASGQGHRQSAAGQRRAVTRCRSRAAYHRAVAVAPAPTSVASDAGPTSRRCFVEGARWSAGAMPLSGCGDDPSARPQLVYGARWHAGRAGELEEDVARGGGRQRATGPAGDRASGSSSSSSRSSMSAPQRAMSAWPASSSAVLARYVSGYAARLWGSRLDAAWTRFTLRVPCPSATPSVRSSRTTTSCRAPLTMRDAHAASRVSNQPRRLTIHISTTPASAARPPGARRRRACAPANRGR